MSKPSAETPPRILVVDDDQIVAGSLAAFLDHEGYDATIAHSAEDAMALLTRTGNSSAPDPLPPFNLLLTDMRLPGASGLELVRYASKHHPDIVSVMLTAYGSIESAVDTVRAGAFDYLAKPLIDDELRLTLEKALRQQVLLAQNTSLKQQLEERKGLGAIVGRDHRMQRAFELIENVAPTKATVLMTGESGTGKSMVARAVHQLSPRASKPYVEIHCGSIPEALLESELFGHVQGAFTGAHADKQGKFLAANGGTIFIDEINSASPAMQLKLLRILQERQFEAVGSTETIEVDVRVILATNKPLEPMVKAGEFREDLYYRINVIRIELPPLRDRQSDIVPLTHAIIDRHAREHNREIIGITDDALAALQAYPFPGNVRELGNIIERAVILSKTPTITLADLPAALTDPGAATDPIESAAPSASPDAPDAPWTPMPLAQAMLDPERRIILKALKANDWNRTRTAEQLEINRTTLYKKMRSLGIDRIAS